MAFGFGGHGGGPGGHGGFHGGGFHGGGFGGFGGNAGGFHGGRGGFHGFGGFHGGGFFGIGFFGFGHFGFNSNGIAGNSHATSNDVDPTLVNTFPANVTTIRPTPTAEDRVDLFLINMNSIKRAHRWLYALTALASIIVALTALNISNLHWFGIFLLSASVIPSALSHSLRNLISECYDCPTANTFCLLACLISLIGLPIALRLGNSPYVFIISIIASLIGNVIGNCAFRSSITSQFIRGFDNDKRSYRHRSLGASSIGRFVELLILTPTVFVHHLPLPMSIWLSIGIFATSLAIEFVLSPIVCSCCNQLISHLSAASDYIADD